MNSLLNVVLPLTTTSQTFELVTKLSSQFLQKTIFQSLLILFTLKCCEFLGSVNLVAHIS